MDNRIRIIAENTLLRIDRLATPRIKNIVTMQGWKLVLLPYFKKILSQIPDAELKQSFHDSYLELKPIFEQAQMSHQLLEAKQYNDPEMIKKLMKLPDFEKAMELVEGVL